MTVPVTAYIVLAGVLFSLGALTVLLRRNAIIELMGVELMLNAVNLVLVTFSRIHGNLTGQVFAFFVMVVAAAEVVVGHVGHRVDVDEEADEGHQRHEGQ